MAEELITIELEGRDEVFGEVRLSDFITELNALKVSLSRTQQEVTDDEKAVEYRVAGLSYASPYRVTVGIRSIAPAHAGTPRRIARRFTASLRAVRTNHRYARRVDPDTLESFKALTSPKGVKSVKVYMAEKPQVKLDSAFSRHLEQLTETAYSEFDEIAGRLEQVNIHNRNQFHIYPSIGARRLFCKATSGLRQDIIDSVGKRVRVEGKAHYRRDAQFPHEMSVMKISSIPTDDKLPRLSDLFGIAPNATGGEAPEDFIREFRNGNW